MITRYAFFQGQIRMEQKDKFREAVLSRLVPLWTQFPGQIGVKVTFGRERDEGAPEFPLILAISYPDRHSMDEALDSNFREQSRTVTAEIVNEYFNGFIHHHVTEAHNF
ncbi:MAG: hypothetical protein KDB22_20680 [Planctomycetales bacterium]|nr:hypothetical protein [Planctomycetales bacterium]MCC0025148.1 hypothetical protein [Hyphomicrobiaceae bacterium]